MSGSASSLEQLESNWSNQVVWWHAAFVAVWGAQLVILLSSDTQASRVPALLALGGIAVSYAALGQRALRIERSWADGVYLALAWSGSLLLTMVSPDSQAWVLGFILFPQTWAIVAVRPAVWINVVAVVLHSTVWFVRSDRTDSAIASLSVIAVVSLAVSIGLGLFIDNVMRTASVRAAIIDELHETQERLAAVERDRGVHEERERLSREIHDTLAQGFTSVLAMSRAADAALARGDVPTARERLGLVQLTASDNLREARLIVAELAPVHLQSRTLVEALDRLVDSISAEGPIRADLVVEGEPVGLGTDTEVVLLRTAQETLSNVRRHSGAAAATIRISYARPTSVVLEVGDDGSGFDPRLRHRGFGLDGVRARAAEAGGTVEVNSEPGMGTRVRVEVPR